MCQHWALPGTKALRNGFHPCQNPGSLVLRYETHVYLMENTGSNGAYHFSSTGSGFRSGSDRVPRWVSTEWTVCVERPVLLAIAWVPRPCSYRVEHVLAFPVRGPGGTLSPFRKRSLPCTFPITLFPSAFTSPTEGP